MVFILFSIFFFFFDDPATTEIYTLSLHDALLIFKPEGDAWDAFARRLSFASAEPGRTESLAAAVGRAEREIGGQRFRSEEHTSELQSRFDLVCRLLLEKKKMCVLSLNTISNELQS